MPVVKITKHLASVTNVPLGLEDFRDDDDTLSEVSSSWAESRPIGVFGDLIIPALGTNRGSHSLKRNVSFSSQLIIRSVYPWKAFLAKSNVTLAYWAGS
jgi:hypothetical protein